MIEIKNLLFQPLSLHRRDGTGIHLGPRKRATIEDDAVSEEMRRAEARSVLSMAPVAEASSRESLPDTPVPAAVPPADPPTAEDPAHPRRKKDK